MPSDTEEELDDDTINLLLTNREVMKILKGFEKLNLREKEFVGRVVYGDYKKDKQAPNPAARQQPISTLCESGLSSEDERILQNYKEAERNGFSLSPPAASAVGTQQPSHNAAHGMAPPVAKPVENFNATSAISSLPSQIRSTSHGNQELLLRPAMQQKSTPQQLDFPWLEIAEKDQRIAKIHNEKLEALRHINAQHPSPRTQGLLTAATSEVPLFTRSAASLPAPALPNAPIFTSNYYPESDQLIDLGGRNNSLPTINAATNTQPPILGASDFAGRMSISQALSLIPHFDGSPDRLNLFCASIRSILANFGRMAEPYIILTLANKLTGKAADGYTARLASYTSVEQLLSDLSMQYSNVGLADEILARIKVIQQDPRESAGDFGLKVQQLHNSLLTIYDSAPDLLPNDRDCRKRGADAEALQQFMFGLQQPLEHQVRTERPRTLSEAIRLAVDFEARQSARRRADLMSYMQQPAHISQSSLMPNSRQHANATVLRATADLQKDKVCEFCNFPGHSEIECRKKRNKSISCDYCKYPGHSYLECFSLRNDIQNGKVQKYKDNNAGARANNYDRSYNSRGSRPTGPNYSQRYSNTNSNTRFNQRDNYNRNQNFTGGRRGYVRDGRYVRESERTTRDVDYRVDPHARDRDTPSPKPRRSRSADNEHNLHNEVNNANRQQGAHNSNQHLNSQDARRVPLTTSE